MKKMAVFVEGYTELLFVEKLLLAVANEKAVLIEKREIKGGGARSKARRTAKLIEARAQHVDQKYFVLLYNCAGDAATKTRMMEEYDSMTSFGQFRTIVCMRDVFPGFTREQIPKLERLLPLKVRTAPVAVDFILATMEIEAWFLSEATHFNRISPAITCEAIRDRLGFDPRIDDMSLRAHPAQDIKDCYDLGAVRYEKGSEMPVGALSMESIYVDVAPRVPYLDRLCRIIDRFLTN